MIEPKLLTVTSGGRLDSRVRWDIDQLRCALSSLFLTLIGLTLASSRLSRLFTPLSRSRLSSSSLQPMYWLTGPEHELYHTLSPASSRL
jgi:hypothetical protein